MSKKYAVVDIETTGGMARRDRITEIGIVLMDGPDIIDTFETLVYPERSIPYNIIRVTGITDEMVKDAPRFYEVAKQVVELTEGRIFVAQNVRFDYGFIRNEFESLGYTYTRKQLCTARLSRTLLPQLKRHNLDSLTGYFGIDIERRHRALDDALGAAKVLGNLLNLERTVFHIDRIVNLGVKESRLPKNITLERLHALPEKCGVYYLHNQFGDIIYVGKSKHIKKRICEHFAVHTRKAGNLQQFVDDISYEVTGSELVALLYEAQEIKRIQPEFNKALRKRPKNYYLTFSETPEGYMTIEANKTDENTPGHVNGFRSKQQANQFLKSLVNQFELCYMKMGLEKGEGACFLHNVGKCHGACIGEELPETYNERVGLAEIMINKQFEEDFIIIDAGRTTKERSIIWIKEGVLQGYGFVEEDFQICSEEDLSQAIDPYPATPECFGIIYNYLKKAKGIKILKINQLVNG